VELEDGDGDGVGSEDGSSLRCCRLRHKDGRGDMVRIGSTVHEKRRSYIFWYSKYAVCDCVV